MTINRKLLRWMLCLHTPMSRDQMLERDRQNQSLMDQAEQSEAVSGINIERDETLKQNGDSK